MKSKLALIGLALCMAPLAACTDDYGYGYGGGYWEDYPYTGWYDGYYGSIYDGYWGNDGYFYYRGGAGDRAYRRGDGHHFHRGDASPGGNWHRFNGTTHRPSQGTVMPSFPHSQWRGRTGGHGRH